MEFEKPVLYKQKSHPYYARNVNRVHEQEQIQGGFNQRFAMLLTRSVSSMWTTYIFTVLALIGLFGLLGWLNPFTFLLTTWVSQQFIQLVCLPILGVSQSVIERKQQLQSEEQYQTTEKTYHDAEQMRVHQEAQDAQLIEIHENIQALSVQVARLITLLDKPAPRAKKTGVAK